LSKFIGAFPRLSAFLGASFDFSQPTRPYGPPGLSTTIVMNASVTPVTPARMKPRVRTRFRDLFIGAALWLTLSYAWMPAGVSVPNERSRIYLTVALVDHRTLSVDRPVERFGRIFDLSARGGRLYSDKAPGSSLLGVLPYGFVRLFSGPAQWPIERLVWLMRNWLMIPLGLASFFIMRRFLARDLGLSSARAEAVSAGWILGTCAFHLSTAFMGHQIAALLFLLALIASYRLHSRAALRPAQVAKASKKEPGLLEPPESRSLAALPISEKEAARAPHAGAAWAGLFCGLALLTEYQSALVVAAVGLLVVLAPLALADRLRALGAFALGLLPGLVMLLAYNTAAFGGPAELSYQHLAHASSHQIHSQGIGGVSWPRLPFAFGGLFSLHRGLFATAPFVLLMIPALRFLQSPRGRLVGACWVAVAGYLWFISSTQMWFAGWGYGPRLLVPALVPGVVLAALVIQGWRDRAGLMGLVLGLSLVSLCGHQWVQLVFPELPERFENPLVDVVVPALKAGVLAPNLPGRWFAASPWLGLALFGLIFCAWVFFLNRRFLDGFSGAARRRAQATALACVATWAILLSVIGPSSTTPADKAYREKFLNWSQSLWHEEWRAHKNAP